MSCWRKGFFSEELASAFKQSVPLVVAEGFVSAQESGRRASRVQVYAVDDRFWRFHGLDEVKAPERNDALMSEALAAELDAGAGQSIVLRVEHSSAIPTESLHGRKEDVGRSVRLTVRDVLPREKLGEFSLSPRQGAIRAVFVPLSRMQTLVGQPARANAILIAGQSAAEVERALVSAARVDDFGLRVRALEELGAIALDSRSTMLSEAVATAATRAGERAKLVVVPTLTYLANSIRSGDREIPYSTMTAIDTRAMGWSSPDDERQQPGPIYLNEWAARELQARPGDPISIEYYVWETEGRLITRTADFRVARTLPIAGAAADRDLVPEYPGITDSARVADWDPPFPVDLKRVRPVDEDYWNRYRATPKAFIPIERGQQLWSSRHGALTALRLMPPATVPLAQARDAYEQALRQELDPLAMGFSVYDVRGEGLAASIGATDFGEYFTYFSTFLVVSALLLAGLFFKLGVEQRLQEVGVLQALGLDPAAIRKLFVGEGLVLSLAGGAAGHCGRSRLQLAHHAWTAHLVDRCGRHDGAAAARRSAYRSSRGLLRSCSSPWRPSGGRSGRSRRRRPARCCLEKGVGSLFRGVSAKTAPDPFSRRSPRGPWRSRFLPAARPDWCREPPASLAQVRSRSWPCCVWLPSGCAVHTGDGFAATDCGPCGGSAGETRHTARVAACSASRSLPLRRSSSSRSKRSSATIRPSSPIGTREAADIRC